MIHENKTKINIPACAAFILLCLTLITTHLTSEIYARYAVSAYVFDSAKTIAFGSLNIYETGDFIEDNNMMIIPGVDLNKNARVSFEGSESATYIFLEITVTPSGRWERDKNNFYSLKIDNKEIMNWSINNKWTYLTQANEGRYIYYQMIESNKTFNENIIENDMITVSEYISNADINSINNIGDININFRASAVQSTGFESPQDAWDSIIAQ